MEILEGILNNQESENQSLLCIRDLVFIDEQIKNEMTEYCNNKKESVVLELKSLIHVFFLKNTHQVFYFNNT